MEILHLDENEASFRCRWYINENGTPNTALIALFVLFVVMTGVALTGATSLHSHQRRQAILGLVFVLLPALYLMIRATLSSNVWRFDCATDTITETKHSHLRKRRVATHRLYDAKRFAVQTDTEAGASVVLVLCKDGKESVEAIYFGTPTDGIIRAVEQLNAWLDSTRPTP